jgi:hypothetical protein
MVKTRTEGSMTRVLEHGHELGTVQTATWYARGYEWHASHQTGWTATFEEAVATVVQKTGGGTSWNYAS